VSGTEVPRSSKTPSPLGSPLFPDHRATVGSYGGGSFLWARYPCIGIRVEAGKNEIHATCIGVAPAFFGERLVLRDESIGYRVKGIRYRVKVCSEWYRVWNKVYRVNGIGYRV